MEAIYLDHSSTTPLDKRVLESMLPVFTKHFGNASSDTHVFGWQAKELVENARQKVAKVIGASPEEIIFTSGATESNNLALKGFAFNLARTRPPSHCKIVSCTTEHNSVLSPLRYLKELGISTALIGVDTEGHIDPTDLINTCKDDCDLLSIMHVNNETGTLHNIEKLIENLTNSKTLIHCDATQSLGKIPIDVQKMRVDFLSISAHKIYGPKGIGALYIRKENISKNPTCKRLTSLIDPLIESGSTEQGLRGGTLNTAAVVGFGQACLLASEEIEQAQEHTQKLSNSFLQFMQSKIDGIQINGSANTRINNILNIFIPGLNQARLFGKICGKLAISTGSACSSGNGHPSHVLQAMGLNNERIMSSIRISFGRETKKAEVEHAADIICKACKHE